MEFRLTEEHLDGASTTDRVSCRAMFEELGLELRVKHSIFCCVLVLLLCFAFDRLFPGPSTPLYAVTLDLSDPPATIGVYTHSH